MHYPEALDYYAILVFHPETPLKQEILLQLLVVQLVVVAGL